MGKRDRVDTYWMFLHCNVHDSSIQAHQNKISLFYIKMWRTRTKRRSLSLCFTHIAQAEKAINTKIMTYWHGPWGRDCCRPKIPIITQYRHLSDTKPSGGSVVCYVVSYAESQEFRSHRWHVGVPNLEDGWTCGPIGGGAPDTLVHMLMRLTVSPVIKVEILFYRVWWLDNDNTIV